LKPSPNGYAADMTAPGQEPDEVLTAKPERDEDHSENPNLDKIGDSHMPNDLRESQREKGDEGDEGDSGSD